MSNLLHFKKQEIYCETCLDTYETISGDVCQDCCPHDETDHAICIDCGVDCLDDLIAKVDFYD